jgi:glycerol kinase
MSTKYVIGIDQSTQGTKALLFDDSGKLLHRCDISHRQIISPAGWVSHDPEEIYQNTLRVVRKLLDESGVEQSRVAALGISNQRETTVAWNKETGVPLCDAIVWQCARATGICQREAIAEKAESIRQKTGLNLSPYFPAAKMAWIMEHVPEAGELAKAGKLALGTMDSWLVYKLSKNKEHRTDYSNASRTQLFHLKHLAWDPKLAELFGIPVEALPEVTDSDACFGYTDFDGLLDHWIPIHGVLGDSHGALFAQGCHQPGMTKTTYGTGSSIMMHIGEEPVLSSHGLVTSLAWKRRGKAEYVLEGNLNYTGAVITWLKDEIGLIATAQETASLASEANQADHVYLVPAFSGLGAPYWQPDARAGIIGMDRTTGKREIVRAALECIAYQITDVLKAMEQDLGQPPKELRVDGGPTKNPYLMQFQSDMASAQVLVPKTEELSGIGAAYMAGISMGILDENVFERLSRVSYHPVMESAVSEAKYAGWKDAVGRVL